MGIDISAYKQIKEIECNFNADGKPIDPETGELFDYDDVKQFYKNPDFPGRATEIKDKCAYKYSDSDHFFSTGYGSYSRLRDQLAELAGYPLGEYEQYGGMRKNYCVACWNGEVGPFSELINFSDCEGVIGSEVAKKLLNDFNDFQEKADALNDDRFLTFYNSMKSAFEMASDNGVVRFH